MERKTILISPADSNILNFFGGQYNVILSDKIEGMISFEQCHADMQALKIRDKLFINSQSKNVLKKLDQLQIEHTVCDNIGCEYPENVALNSALIGEKLFCKKSALHPLVRNYCECNGIKIIDVKQGYTKCSVLILSENSIITDDQSIYNVAIKNGISALLIDKGDIYLDSKTSGFIGGASTKIGDTVYFFGNIDTHRNHKEIKTFIKQSGFNYESITEGKLIDIGGIVEI